MTAITDKRKLSVFHSLLRSTDYRFHFLDVGSGGSLKYPWTLLPAEKLDKIDFDPEIEGDDAVCISDRSCNRTFYVAKNPRASSLHLPNPKFVERFGMEGLNPAKELSVRCASLDHLLGEKGHPVDLMDINTEGHDFHVLKGATETFQSGSVMLLKIEFELTKAWQGQGFFSDIDSILRSWNYEIIDIDVSSIRPKVAKKISYAGEPAWGKAWYAPRIDALKLFSRNSDDPSTYLKKAAALYSLFNAPARAIEIVRDNQDVFGQTFANQFQASVEHAYRFNRLESLLDKLKSTITRRLTRV